MFYDTRDELRRKSFLTRAGHLAGKGCLVELRERKQRTLGQNSYLHVICAWMAQQLGETTAYVKEHYYKHAANPMIFVGTRHDPVLGHDVVTVRSSAELTAEEMSLSIERFRNWALDNCGIYIPTPDDHRLVWEMERQVLQDQRL